jgi:hypothetical protein
MERPTFGGAILWVLVAFPEFMLTMSKLTFISYNQQEKTDVG